VFKKAFHEGDLEPGAQSKYAQTKKLLRSIEHNEMHDMNRAKCYTNVVAFLDLSPSSHKHVIKDMARAYIAMCPFFPNLDTYSLNKFYDTDHGSEFKKSDILNSTLRAQNIPDRRRHDSNRYMPMEFFSEWLKLRDTPSFSLPREWELVVRPIIAKCKPSCF
jgi:hypothetical protein